MKLQCVWNDKMRFTAEAASHEVVMGTLPPIGADWMRVKSFGRVIAGLN
jgi:hypothetical protein